MKYTVTKRRYLDTLIIFLIGVGSLVLLSFFIKKPLNVITKPTKLQVKILPSDQFIYISDDSNKNSIHVFNVKTQKDTALYATNSAEEIINANLIQNKNIYVDGISDFGLNITDRKLLKSYGDYISPDGGKFISIENPEDSNGLLIFSNSDTKNQHLIKTTNSYSSLNKILGWSSDSNYFYYTTAYQITKQIPEQVTDHWTQLDKRTNKMIPMSRVRTWTEYSTSSAQMVFQINAQNNTVAKLFANSGLGIIRNAFYNQSSNQFYIENDTNLFSILPDNSNLIQISLKPTVATAAASIIFDPDNPNRFLHSDGKSLALADLKNNQDQGLFYASNSATVTPLSLLGNTVIFSLQNNNYMAGEILDTLKQTRTEFGRTDIDPFSKFPSNLLFVSWIREVRVN